MNARNEQALAEALIRELGKDILAPRKNGPQHDYYIGLAYLYGIDVEIDRAVAFSLIKRSAERGYAPAMEKLTEMYRNGDGVGVDYSEALAWQRLLVEKYRTRLKEKGCKFLDYIHYFGVLSTLFDYLFEYGATSEINQVCNDALVIANNLYAKAPGPLSRYYVAMIHFTLAEYYVQCGRFDAALENAHKSRELREKNSEEEWSYNEDLLPVYSLIEHIYHSLGDTKNRAIYREKIARLKETINEPLSETDFAFDVFKKVGAIMSEDGIHLEEYDGALEILKQKYKRNRSDENLRSLGQGYSIYATRLSSELRKQRRMPGLPPSLSTGSTYAFGGENGPAKKLSLFVEVINLNRKSIEIYEDIVKRTGVVTDLRNLATNHRKMAEFILDILSEFDTGDEKVASYYADADRHFKRSIELYSEVVRRTDYIDDKSNLAEIIAQRVTHVARMYNLALVGEEALHEGLALLEEGMKIANELLSLVKSVDHESVFHSICLAFSNIYLALGDKEKAEYYDNLALISQN